MMAQRRALAPEATAAAKVHRFADCARPENFPYRLLRLYLAAHMELDRWLAGTELGRARARFVLSLVLDGRELGRIFSLLRLNELLGNKPPAFDLLYWNQDSTRLPAALHGELIDIYRDDTMARPGWVVVGFLNLCLPWSAAAPESGDWSGAAPEGAVLSDVMPDGADWSGLGPEWPGPRPDKWRAGAARVPNPLSYSWRSPPAPAERARTYLDCASRCCRSPEITIRSFRWSTRGWPAYHAA